jgi:hypothetical protein
MTAMAQGREDLTDDELNWIADRLTRVLEGGPRPFLGLQYRLGEVGQGRIGPRMLRRALAELSNNRRPRRGKIREAGPWEPIREVFASSSLSRDEAHEKAVPVTDAVASLLGVDHLEIVDRLCTTIAGAVAGFLPHVGMEGPVQVSPPPDQTAPCPNTRILIGEAPAPIRLWVSHEAGWLYPDNPQLWAFLVDCVRKGAHPLIVARHIDQTTFALFKAIGVRGVQYYSWLVPGERSEELAPLGKEIGWLHVRAVEAIAEHQVIEQIHGAVRHFEKHPDAMMGAAILAGETSGLASPSASPDALLEWARSAGVEMAKGWRETVHRWHAWARYRVPRRPGAALQQHEQPAHLQPVTTSAPTQEPQLPNPAASTNPATPEAPDRWSFGRETKITRVPITLRRY